jgi:hypothetical protein
MERSITDFGPAKDMVHHSTIYLSQREFANSSIVDVSDDRANILQGVEFIQNKVQMKDVLRMYNLTMPSIQSRNMFDISVSVQPVNQAELIRMHSIRQKDVNQVANVTIMKLEDIRLTIEANTMEMLFEFASNYGILTFIKYSNIFVELF